MLRPYVVFGLPRSRTAWLSRFLTYGDWFCGHEQARYASGLEDVQSWLSQPCTGTCETAIAPWWRLLVQRCPDVRVVVVRRAADAVVESLIRSRLSSDRALMAKTMTRLDAKLDQISCRVPGALSVQFDDLADENACAAVFEYCLPYQHDAEWWRQLAGLNIQIHAPALLRQVAAYYPQMSRVGAQAKHHILAAMAVRRAVPPDGVTIREEPFDSFIETAGDLLQDHCVDVNERPDSYMGKNLPLFKRLDQMGALQIMVGRSNGRAFGYLTTVVHPSLENPNTMSAQHTTFYASKDFPGLGGKLQRASAAALRAKGVTEVFMRAGVRGSGPRMAPLYRRLGAEDLGQMFRLPLAGV